MIDRKDDQIGSLLERDRETNILIQGLQRTLSKTLGIGAPPEERSRVVEADITEPEQSTNLFQEDDEEAIGKREGDSA